MISRKLLLFFDVYNLQFQSGLPVTSRSGAILKTTVVREKWELNNDDIELVSDKLFMLKQLFTKIIWY